MTCGLRAVSLSLPRLPTLRLPASPPFWLRHLPVWLLPGYLAACALLFLVSAPLAQDLRYHNFADSRTVFGLENFADVTSNLAILVGGVWGLYACWRAGANFASAFERTLATLFFSALVLTAVGSAYYHLDPDTTRLFWDRLPIGLAFTTVLAWLLSERAAPTPCARRLLMLWLCVGPASVIYWYWSEVQGTGDLRLYLLLHLATLLLIPAVLCTPTRWTHRHHYFAAYVAFVLGMTGDAFDREVLALLGGTVSGHTLKHVFMGLAAALLAHMILYRRRHPEARQCTSTR